MSTQLAAPRRIGGPGHRGIGLAPLAWTAIALYVAFLIYPIVQSVITSFTDRNPPLKPASAFVGFANYLELFQDQRLARSLGFTLVVVVFVTIVANAFGSCSRCCSTARR